MNVIKKIFIGLLVAIALLIVASLFLPSKVHMEREILISADKKTVYSKCVSIQEFRSWNPWDKIDPNAKITYFGPDSGPGAGYTWDSPDKNVGKGKYTILSVSEPDSVYAEMDFMENGKANATFRIKQEGEQTKVIWGFDSDMGMNPIAKFMGLMMEKFLGPDYEKGLKALKAASELAVSQNTEAAV